MLLYKGIWVDICFYERVVFPSKILLLLFVMLLKYSFNVALIMEEQFFFSVNYELKSVYNVYTCNV
jgi:hypothetical protein